MGTLDLVARYACAMTHFYGGGEEGTFEARLRNHRLAYGTEAERNHGNFGSTHTPCRVQQVAMEHVGNERCEV